jgi:DNA-binding transcriptional regulator YiaG
MNFPTNLKQARKKAKMLQQKLADSLGVRQSAVANWEKGYRKPKHSKGEEENSQGDIYKAFQWQN